VLFLYFVPDTTQDLLHGTVLILQVGKDKNFPGVTIQSEAPLLVTTGVKLVDPETLKPTEIEWRYTEDGDKVSTCFIY
jgi:hypothetical protein